jgi:hypothetical protein
VRAASIFVVVAFLAACAGESEEDLRPGPITIGVVHAEGERETLVARGVQVAVGRINGFGGIGGAAPIQLVGGPVERLLDREIGLLVLPCDQEAARAASIAVADAAAVAVAPCDDGGLPSRAGVLRLGLSPEQQADVLVRHAPDPLSLLPSATPRGRLVERLVRERADVAASEPNAGADAPENVLPPPGTPDDVVFVTFGFPDPGRETDEFYERFKAMFGQRPESIVAALAADALDTLALAIEESASSDPTTVAEYVREEGLTIDGVLGELEVEPGETRARSPWVVLRTARGRFELVARSD